MDNGVDLRLGRDGILQLAKEQLEANARTYLNTDAAHKTAEWAEVT